MSLYRNMSEIKFYPCNVEKKDDDSEFIFILSTDFDATVDACFGHLLGKVSYKFTVPSDNYYDSTLVTVCNNNLRRQLFS